MTASLYTDIEFSRIYNSCNSTNEVAEKTGLPRSAVHSRAARYRKLGVRLKRFPGSRGRSPVNVEAVNRMLEEEGLAPPVEEMPRAEANGEAPSEQPRKRSHKKKVR